jgi:hypothetical protein
MKCNTHAVVPEPRFRLLQGEGSLSCYQVRCGCRPLAVPAILIWEHESVLAMGLLIICVDSMRDSAAACTARLRCFR